MLVELIFFTQAGEPTTPTYTHGEDPIAVIDALGSWTIQVTQNGTPFLHPLMLCSTAGLDGTVAMQRRSATATAMIDGRVACIARPAYAVS